MPNTLTQPAHLWVPDYASTNGDIAAEVGGQLGLTPDDDQRAILDAIFAEREDGNPSCFEVGIIAPRQNIKTSTLEIAALTDLYVFEEPLHIWTAHKFSTARATFEHMKMLIESNPDYARRTEFTEASGNESIRLRTGERIEFHARSKGAGRGKTGAKVTLDEALFIGAAEMGALLPTMATVPSAQVRYGSSAGMVSSDVLRGVRNRGRKGHDPALAYFEWCAPRVDCQQPFCSHAQDEPGCALDDVELLRLANPALGRRITEERLQQFRGALPPMEFAREFLGWWEDPPDELGGAFDVTRWGTLADPSAERGSPTFGVCVAPDRSWSAVAVAWKRPDGHTQVMLADYRPTTTWVAERVAELRANWGGQVILDTNARDLVEDAEEPSQAEQARAHASLADAVTAGTVRHGNEPALNTAVSGARWRPSGDGQVLDRKGRVDISPIIAAALALHYADDGESVYEGRGLVTL